MNDTEKTLKNIYAKRDKYLKKRSEFIKRSAACAAVVIICGAALVTARVLSPESIPVADVSSAAGNTAEDLIKPIESSQAQQESTSAYASTADSTDYSDTSAEPSSSAIKTYSSTPSYSSNISSAPSASYPSAVASDPLSSDTSSGSASSDKTKDDFVIRNYKYAGAYIYSEKDEETDIPKKITIDSIDNQNFITINEKSNSNALSAFIKYLNSEENDFFATPSRGNEYVITLYYINSTQTYYYNDCGRFMHDGYGWIKLNNMQINYLNNIIGLLN